MEGINPSCPQILAPQEVQRGQPWGPRGSLQTTETEAVVLGAGSVAGLGVWPGWVWIFQLLFNGLSSGILLP